MSHKIAILLCTYQGERFLEKQLDSIYQQSHTNWILYVSDDGSRDQTLSLLKKYQQIWGEDKLIILSGPKKGFAANFLSLLRLDIEADYFSLADQDDIWEKDKLSRAILQLQQLTPEPSPSPALYCSRTQLIDEEDYPIGYTPLYTKPPCFENALVQNIAGGNTMVLNQAAHQLILNTPSNLTLAFHDWWIYLVITGCGGKVIYDAYPSVRYRQHTLNQIGANQSYLALLLRIRLLLSGSFIRWNEFNIKGLNLFQSYLTPHNQRIFKQYCEIRQGNFIKRLTGFFKIGVFRQTAIGNLKLLAAVLLKKV
jgi:glycosyltransferase involved in cell wall biosynthesis